jgi:hypothetical protein
MSFGKRKGASLSTDPIVPTCPWIFSYRKIPNCLFQFSVRCPEQRVNYEGSPVGFEVEFKPSPLLCCRRIVGIAHVEDLESIADPDVRASCEKPALDFGKMLLRNPSQFCNIERVASALESPVMVY